MNRHEFVRLAVLAIGIVVVSFVVLGFGRLVLPFRTAQLLAAPIGLVGFALLVYLFVRATLATVGVWAIETDQ